MSLIIKEELKGDNSINFVYYENLNNIYKNIIQVFSVNGNIIINCLNGEITFGTYYDDIKYQNKVEFQNITLLFSNNIDYQINDNYLIKWAIYYSKLNFIKFLIQNGANIHTDNNHPLRWACKKGHIET